MSILYFAAVASAVTFAPTQSDEPTQVRVKYHDLDLASPAGRESLDRRLKLAVQMACGRKVGQPAYVLRWIYKCQTRATSEIEPQRAFAIANSGVKLASGR